jgi:hypothetical protein
MRDPWTYKLAFPASIHIKRKGTILSISDTTRSELFPPERFNSWRNDRSVLRRVIRHDVYLQSTLWTLPHLGAELHFQRPSNDHGLWIWLSEACWCEMKNGGKKVLRIQEMFPCLSSETNARSRSSSFLRIRLVSLWWSSGASNVCID